MKAEMVDSTEKSAGKIDKDQHSTIVHVASYISGYGISLPERVIPNDYFASYLETSDQWIRDRTGIAQRRWVESSVGASELAEGACRAAVKRAGLELEHIDGVIVATATPDYVFPSTACFLQKRLGLKPGVAFDLSAACSGFIYALSNADALIAAGHAQHLLVVGVEIYSSIINLQDRSTCVLFGDGAAAVVLSRAEAPSGCPSKQRGRYLSGSSSTMRGIYGSLLLADGSGADMLSVPNGSAARPTPESLASGAHALRMSGREVFKLAVRSLYEVNMQMLEKVGIPIDAVDLFVTHQANERIIRAVGKQLGVDESRVPMNVQRYGNTSAASIPILLTELAESGRLKQGDLALLSAFGGGVTWGALLIRW